MFNTSRTKKGQLDADPSRSRWNLRLAAGDLEYLNFLIFPSPKSSPFWRFFTLFECVTQNSINTAPKGYRLRPAVKPALSESSPGWAAVGGYCAGDSLPHIRAGQLNLGHELNQTVLVPITNGLIDNYYLEK